VIRIANGRSKYVYPKITQVKSPMTTDRGVLAPGLDSMIASYSSRGGGKKKPCKSSRRKMKGEQETPLSTTGRRRGKFIMLVIKKEKGATNPRISLKSEEERGAVLSIKGKGKKKLGKRDYWFVPALKKTKGGTLHPHPKGIRGGTAPKWRGRENKSAVPLLKAGKKRKPRATATDTAFGILKRESAFSLLGKKRTNPGKTTE